MLLLALKRPPVTRFSSLLLFSEDIGVVAIVVAELELVKVERQIFLAYVVVRADNAALEQGPERINVLSVDLATHVLTLYVADGLMRIGGRQQPISTVFIGRDKRDLFRNSFATEASSVPVSVFSIIWQMTLPLRLIVPPPLNLSLARRFLPFPPT